MVPWCHINAALAGLCLLSGCGRHEPKIEPSAPKVQTDPVTATLPAVDAPLDREALILEARRAASNAALGTSDAERQREIDGKPFELRLRFGCPGIDSDSKSRGWMFDEASRKFSLHIEPEIVRSTPVIQSLGALDYESVEGFWIRRPWLLQTGCPTPVTRHSTPSAQPVPETDKNPSLRPTSPKLGIAQFFTDADARTHRRDNRGYAATKVMAGDAKPSEAGYDLVIAGRLRRLPNGAVVTCVTYDPDTAPDCVISVNIDNVAIDDPTSGERIANWSQG